MLKAKPNEKFVTEKNQKTLERLCKALNKALEQPSTREYARQGKLGLLDSKLKDIDLMVNNGIILITEVN